MKTAVTPYLAAVPALGRAASPPQAGGTGTTYVNLVMRISKDKPPQILRATQLSGRVISRSNSIPSYLFAFTKKNRPSYIQYLPDNPFMVRGFVDPKHPEKGETLLESESTTVIVNVPDTDMSSATKDLGLQVFSVSPAGMKSVTESGAIGADALLSKLKNSNGVSMKAELPSSQLGQAVKSIE
jgi:hypothetical protein